MIYNHFRAYREVVFKIRSKNMELMKLKEDWYNLTGVRLSDMPKGGKPMDMADQLHRIVEKEKGLSALVNYREELRKVHEKEIDNIEDLKKRTILKLFFLDNCSIKQIAQCIDKSEPHTKKLKRDAIEEFINIVILSNT